jgi:hypothetical protein
MPCSITDTVQCILNPPQLTLAPQSILTHQLEFCIKTLLLVRTLWFLESLTICTRKCERNVKKESIVKRRNA